MPRSTAIAFTPAFSFLPFSLDELVEDVRATWFPELAGPIPVFFVEFEPLACAVTSVRDGYPAVYFHQILNHPATPIEVLRAIAKHELVHFIIPPRVVRGRSVWDTRTIIHPPEFWDAEERLAPEMPYVWTWLRANFGRCLSDGGQGLRVTRTWRRFELTPRTPWVESELQFAAVYEWMGRRRGARSLPGKGRAPASRTGALRTDCTPTGEKRVRARPMPTVSPVAILTEVKMGSG